MLQIRSIEIVTMVTTESATNRSLQRRQRARVASHPKPDEETLGRFECGDLSFDLARSLIGFGSHPEQDGARLGATCVLSHGAIFLGPIPCVEGLSFQKRPSFCSIWHAAILSQIWPKMSLLLNTARAWSCGGNYITALKRGSRAMSNKRRKSSKTSSESEGKC